MNRIVLTNPDGSEGRVVHAGGEFAGPLPPNAGEFRAIYERMLAQGVLPEPFEEAPRLRAVDALTFRRLFTADERLAITSAGYGDAMVRMFMDDAAAAGTLSLDHPDVLDGIAYLVSAGLLTPARAEEVKAAEPPS